MSSSNLFPETFETLEQSFPGHSLTEFRNDYAFSGIRSDGTVISWGLPNAGGDSASVHDSLVNVIKIFSNSKSFAALKSGTARP